MSDSNSGTPGIVLLTSLEDRHSVNEKKIAFLIKTRSEATREGKYVQYVEKLADATAKLVREGGLTVHPDKENER